MSNTYSYEVFVPEKGHYDEEAKKHVVDRPAKKIATETGVYPEPKIEDLIDQYWEQLKEAGITPGTVKEVAVKVGPFLP